MDMEQMERVLEENSKLKKKLKKLMDDYKSLFNINKDMKNNIFIDEITQLYNNRYLDIRLGEEMKRAKRYTQFLSFVLVSVQSLSDDIQKNGNEKVREKIRHFGKFLQANMRDTDILSQYSDEIIALILPETNIDGAKTLSERLKEQILLAYSDSNSTNIQQGKALSIGIASYPTDASMKDELINRAIEMLERSKNDANNSICSSLLSQ